MQAVASTSTKTTTSSSSDCYSECLLSRRVTIPFKTIGRGDEIKTVLNRCIRSQIENKCTIEGFVHPDTCRIITHSSGTISGSNIVFDVAFSCSVFAPAEGAILVCSVKSVTHAGILAGINGVTKVEPVVVYVLREHHSGDTDDYFNSIKSGTVIRVKVIGQRFELNDKHVSVIGELLKPDATLIQPQLQQMHHTPPTFNLPQHPSQKQNKPDNSRNPTSKQQDQHERSSVAVSTDARNYGKYFRHQNEIASCGRLALNHLMQQEVFTFSTDPGYKNIMNLDVQPESPINLHQLCYTMRNTLKGVEALHDEFVCERHENHSLNLMMAAMSICKYRMMELPDPNKDIITVAIKSKYDGADAVDVEWKILINENGSPRGGHWVFACKYAGDVGIYYFNSLGNSVKKYASVDTFIHDYIKRTGDRTQFAMLEPMAEYVSPLAKYNF
jgi:DNA-directed RNA polymerase subunit E'/Rpb7